jgi:hypothetical protein
MKLFQALVYCLCGLFSPMSEAAQVRWNFPGSVSLFGNYSVSGSFTADLDTLQLMSSDHVFRLNGAPVNLHGVYGIYYGTFGNVTDNWMYFVAGNTVGVPAVAITYSTLTNAGGSADVYMVSGTCSVVRAIDNVCTGFTGQVPRTVTLTGTPVPSIPTAGDTLAIFSKRLEAKNT